MDFPPFGVSRARGEERPIGGDRERIDPAIVGEHLVGSPRRQVPDPDGPVPAAGDERLAVGEECEGHDVAQVGFGSGQSVLACRQVPEVKGLSVCRWSRAFFHRAKMRAGRRQPAVERSKLARVQFLPGRDVKEHERASAPDRGQDLSVGREGHVADVDVSSGS